MLRLARQKTSQWLEKFYFIENWAYFPLFVDVEAGITLSDGSSNGNIIESDSERLSDHSGDDSNESVESVIKDSTKIETEGYCEDCSLHRTYGQLAWKTKNTCSIAVLP